jgi:hypothetical protein
LLPQAARVARPRTSSKVMVSRRMAIAFRDGVAPSISVPP